MPNNVTIEGLHELQQAFYQLGKVPQVVANKSARAGSTIAKKAAKANSPVDQGDLKRGIIAKKERRIEKGKAVYDVLMNPAMNDIFVKISADGKRSYYPASQEYGFLTVSGRYIPGYHYLRDALTDNATDIERKILEITGREVDKALQRQAGGS